MQISQEKEYQILPTMDKGLIFAINMKPGQIQDPKILYDGGNHALLCRSDDDIVILDYLEPRAKKMMQNLSKAHICEIDYDAQDVEHLYEVHIHQVFQLPFDVESYISVTG